jgi:membrane-associated phospholipid phosphatase
MYSLRHFSILLPFGIVLNMTMILATPTQGGHYLVDVLAGLILAFLSIKIFEIARERVRYLRPSLIVL